jgi:hypothetical protein
MKNFTHHKHEGDALCGTSAINLTTKQHLVSCPKCLDLKPYKVTMPERKVRQKQKSGRLSYNSGVSLHSQELVSAVYKYYLQNNENSFSTIGKIFDLTEKQAEGIINNQFRNR